MRRARLDPMLSQKLAGAVLWGTAATAVAILIFIITAVLIRGLPRMSPTFLFARPVGSGEAGGIWPFIVGTIYLTALAVLIGAPLGVGTAIFLTEYTRENVLTRVVRFGADCLAGIPSIIFGLFGMVFFVLHLRLGFSVLSGALTIALMILPTIIRTSEEAIRAVPAVYRDVSYGLGANRWQMVTRVVLPGAIPGVVTGIMLGVGRSISETAAVMLTAGSNLALPRSPMDPCRTLSLHFYILATEGISRDMAYGVAAVLVLSILAINTAAYLLMHRVIRRFR